MAEREGRPWAAWGILLATLLGSVTLGGCAWAYYAEGCEWGDCEDSALQIVVFEVPAAICLVSGLWYAWRVGTGRTRRSAATGPVEEGRARHISEPGADLADSPGGTKVARLPAGTRVVQVEGQGNYIQVTLADGRSGWLDRRAVF